MGTEAPLWQIFEGLLNIWQSFVPTLSKIIVLGNFYWQ